jgi:hypothetical protein
MAVLDIARVLLVLIGRTQDFITRKQHSAARAKQPVLFSREFAWVSQLGEIA